MNNLPLNPADVSATDIAIIGLAGRFPGAQSVPEFWKNLVAGVESIRDLSEAELAAAGVSPAAFRNTAYVKRGATLAEIDRFDADFFGINPKEASIMDPQQRLFLECAWEAMENAGHAAGRSDELVGVFAGSGPNSYLIHNLLSDPQLVENEGMFVLRHMGNDKDVLATRVSYQMDLHGPSINVQTACSTSLVAVHLACQSLLNRECDLALAGAVSIEIPHGAGYRYREGEILSRDGHCRAFDQHATGTVFGSGVGIVILRPLTDALAAGDTVYAVIKGSAINNDGSRKVGFLAPSVQGQIDAVTQALSVAGVDPDSVDYIEAHGTGTAIGDPIELAALGQVFGGRSHPLLVGGVKTNIGHLDTASGIAALIKTALALNNGRIPPTLHFSAPNPKIDFSVANFKIVDKLIDWPKANAIRRAGVTSLGIGGSNAHVVLEAPPASVTATSSRESRLLTLSAKSAKALEDATTNLIAHLEENPNLNLDAAASTLHLGRREFNYRRTVNCKNVKEALTALHDLDPRKVSTGDVSAKPRELAFLFSGQGAQCVNMGRSLYSSEPVFRRWIDACAAIATPLLGVDFREILYPDADPAAAADRLRQTWITQPAMFAVEYATAQLWLSWGIKPTRMLGHSIGEYVAATLAQVFSFDEAVAIVTKRGLLARELIGGAMLAVGQSEDEIRPLLNQEFSLAAVNAPSQCVVAGSTEAIDRLEQQLSVKRVPARRLQTSHAFHSHLMEPIVNRFVDTLRGYSLKAPHIPLLSNVTGAWLTESEAVDPKYWGAHLRSTVRFNQGLSLLLSESNTSLLEVGPGETLLALAKRHPNRNPKQRFLSSLPTPADPAKDSESIMSALGQLWSSGVEVNWQGFHVGQKTARIPMPAYPFQRQRHWIGPGFDPANTAAPGDKVAHWFYRTKWKQTAAATPNAPIAPWLVFCDSGGIGEAMVQELPQKNQKVIAVFLGDSYRRVNNDEFIINPASPSDFASLFNAIPESDWPRRISCFWPVEKNVSRVTRQNFSFYHLLALLRSLAAKTGSRPVRLDFFTQNAVSANGELVLNPDQSIVAGPCRVAPKEYPSLDCRWIDLDTTEPDTAARLAIAEGSYDSNDSSIAYRNGVRWIQSVQPVPVRPKNARLREKGVYLITGGLGGLGLAVAQWLAKAHHARLVLVSRDASKHQERIKAEISAIESDGGEVCVCQADVTNIDSMLSALTKGRKRFGPIHGVIHAAGVLDDGIIELKEAERARRVLSPKIDGTQVLDQLFRQTPLDFFAVFSSISALTPPAGQVDYCAANAWINAFAENCPPDRHVVALGWSAWSQVGMAHESQKARAALNPPHPLFETVASDANSQTVFRGTFDVSRQWVLHEHRLHGKGALFPGAGHLELAVSAFWRQNGRQPVLIRNVAFIEPLAVNEGQPLSFNLSLRKKDSGFEFFTTGNDTLFASGELEASSAKADKIDLSKIAARCPREERLPRNLRQEHHFNFGPRWRTIQRIMFGQNECLAEVKLPDQFASEVSDYALHPALLDMGTGAGLFLIPGADRPGEINLPFSYRQAVIFKPLPAHFYSHVRLHGDMGSGMASFDITLIAPDGDVIMEITDFAVKRIADANAAFSLNSHKPARNGALPGLEQLSIDPQHGVEALSRILNSGERGVIYISPSDISKESKRTDKARPAAVSDGSDIEGSLRALWQKLLGVDSIELDSDFFQLGGHSLIAVRLFNDIRAVFDVDLGLATLFEARTLRALADRIRDSRAKPAETLQPQLKCVVPIRRTGDHKPFFFIHGVGGALLNYELLARHLPPDQPIYGFQSWGLTGSMPDTSIEEMASRYIEELRQLQPEGPYLLGGHSFGGLVAYEMGRQLEAAGTQPGLIALIDTVQENFNTDGFWISPMLRAAWVYGRVIGHARRIVWGPNRRGYARARLKTLRRRTVNWFDHFVFRVNKAGGRAQPTKLTSVQRANRLAIRRYIPLPSPCSVTLFRCSARSLGDHPDYLMGWKRVALGGVNVEETPGDHLSMMAEPNVGILAEKMSACLSHATNGAVSKTNSTPKVLT